MSKKALVTGGSRGIGAACARALARDGFAVAVNYCGSEAAARALAREIGGQAFRADVSDKSQVDAMFAAWGGVDALVCCAGIDLQKLFTDTEPEEWRRIFAVNVDGAYNACRAAIPHMVHEKYGRIVLVSSMWGIRGASCEAAYSASKAALIGLAKSLAKELGPSGITVNCVTPGVIDTDMNKNLSPETMAELAEETPLGRIGTPEEAAEAAAFLVSDRASFITGQVLSADGGFAV
jgi:3-oxoacyl-[acyl-carrier protein] reductase